MNRSELEYIIKQDVKKRSVRWEKVKFIQRGIEDLLKNMISKQQFNYLEVKRALQLHILVIDEVMKKHEQKSMEKDDP